MIRSTKLSLKFLNKEKKQKITTFITQYNILVTSYINQIWNLEKIPSLLPWQANT